MCVWNDLYIPKPQRHRWKLRIDKLFHLTFYDRLIYLSMLGLKSFPQGAIGWLWSVLISFDGACPKYMHTISQFSYRSTHKTRS